jgi:hypothetical protein
MDTLAEEITTSGLFGYARRLRRMRTEIAGLLNLEKSGPRKIKRRGVFEDLLGD